MESEGHEILEGRVKMTHSTPLRLAFWSSNP